MGLLDKIAGVLLIPIAGTALLTIWTAVVAWAEVFFGFTFTNLDAYETALETYVYAPLFALSQLPVVGTMVEILWWMVIFESILFILKMVLRLLHFFNVTGPSFVD